PFLANLVFSVNLVNPSRRSDLNPAANPEEQILKSRGRRELPRTPTPTRKSSRVLSPASSDSSSSSQPQLSPFTKCLRGILDTPPRPVETNQQLISLRKRLLMSPDSSTEDSGYGESSSTA